MAGRWQNMHIRPRGHCYSRHHKLRSLENFRSLSAHRVPCSPPEPRRATHQRSAALRPATNLAHRQTRWSKHKKTNPCAQMPSATLSLIRARNARRVIAGTRSACVRRLADPPCRRHLSRRLCTSQRRRTRSALPARTAQPTTAQSPSTCSPGCTTEGR